MAVRSWGCLSFALVFAVGCADPAAETPPSAAPSAAAATPPPTAPTPPAPAAVETGQVLADLVANRIHSHRFDGDAWVVPVQSGHFDKLVPFGAGRWRLESKDQQHVAVIDGSGASVRVPERARALGANRARVRLWSKRAGTLELRSAGERLGRVRLEVGWQEHEVELDGAVAGDLEFRASGARRVAVAAFALGRDATPALEKAPAPLALAAGQSLSYYMHVPAGTTLRGAASDGCQIEVAARDGEQRLESQPLPVTFDGESLTGRVARLDIALLGCDAGSRAGSIKELALVSDEPAPTRPPRGKPPSNVLLWVMDTLRADRIKLINPEARPEIPGLERLAARGVVFRRAWVEGNESQASHASVWTSLYPATHAIRTAGKPGNWMILSKFKGIGELMRASGRRTIGLTANGMVTKGGGYARGFQRYENPMRDGTGKRRNGWIPAHKLYKRAIELLEPVVDQRFFFFFGTIDTHKPWVGHQPWLDRYDPGPYRGKFRDAAWPGDLGLVKGSMRCTQVPKPRDLQRINAIYDSDVSYQDKHLGMMLDWLEDKGILDDTLIILTADHGEELFEVGRCGHGASLRETLTNVPLIMSYPGRLPSGVVVEEGVDGVDILPTVLELIGTAPPSQMQGASLVSLAHGEGRGYPRASYASQYEYAHAMRIGDWKIRVGKKVEIYDMRADPTEMTSRTGEHPIAEQQLADALHLFLRHRWSWRKGAWGPANNLTRAGAAALERGYVSEP